MHDDLVIWLEYNRSNLNRLISFFSFFRISHAWSLHPELRVQSHLLIGILGLQCCSFKKQSRTDVLSWSLSLAVYVLENALGS